MATNYEYLKESYKYTNWRFISNSNYRISYKDGKSGSYGSYNKRGVWVLIDTFIKSCFFYGMDVNEFLRISRYGDHNQFRDHYWDQPKTTYCKTCNGAGKIDWISRVTRQPSFEKIRHVYVRDKDKVIVFQNNDFLKGYIFAPTKVFKGERICKDCMGSGVYVNRNNLKDLVLCNINEI